MNHIYVYHLSDAAALDNLKEFATDNHIEVDSYMGRETHEIYFRVPAQCHFKFKELFGSVLNLVDETWEIS